MHIVAKFASKCPACAKPIAAGMTVEWSKGSPARHVDCSAAPAAAAPTTRARAPRAPRLPKLIGIESDVSASFEGSKSFRDPGRELGSLSWLKMRGQRVAVVLVGWSPAQWVPGDVREDMGDYSGGGRGAYLGVLYFRRATLAEYETLQASSPRADGVPPAPPAVEVAS